ncbi:RloB family protein [Patescibacteria group bacterium]|nr:RloB family protein [Patescibacteria group bacterium]
MEKYRGKRLHREAHPKIFVWSHTHKAEIEYFQGFKNHLRTPLLMPQKIICWSPQKLLEQVVEWKTKTISEEDGDQVWCIFDVDDFYKNDGAALIKAVRLASDNNVKIAYANECFELWILLHFYKPTSPINRGSDIEKRIQQEFKKHSMGQYEKNLKVFDALMGLQNEAIKNAERIVPEYNSIDWNKNLNAGGNPSTSIHFLIKEINTLIGHSKKT